MREKILNDLKTAMKEQNKDVLTVIRMIKGAMQLEEINLKRELNDDEIINVIVKQIKTRKESIVEFEKGNRQDLISKTNEEIDILSKYMPEQLTEKEINDEITKAFEEINPTSSSDMGKLMARLTPIFKGKADMSFVSKTIKEKLSNL
ncbi:MAG: GatB/YqeY domain-containing protein [Bacilli bacterium]|nr:GatB/YqeY domain-containing protein [Bacilli bacterium]